MAAPAPVSPAVVHSSSSSRPQRTMSTNARSAAPPPSSPHRSHSHSHTGSQHTNLPNVARRDFEQSNVARAPSESRRDPSRDRTHTSQSQHARYASDASTGAQPADTQTQTPTRAPGNNTSGRRRTTIGAQTGQWALGKTIGAGSMGKVKLARNVETGEQVAVKIVPRQSTDEHRSQADRERADHSKEVRTAREAAIVTLVNHPYICGMRDVVRTNYHWYMLFEYVNGGQMLDYIISHGRLKEKQARKFGRQIASALDYCHRNSIVHRDLKIENILISKTGDIKIIDFGLSNLFSPKSHLKTFCGSLYFAAPELLQAKQYTGPEVDIWSFGIVLYVLVCGKVPFDDQSMPQLHAKIKKGHVEYPPWLSAECKNLISRMLVTDPRQRANLSEIMNHPWITKGFNAPPENFLPHREPLRLPLDTAVIEKMTGFDFGSPEYITSQLTKIIESEDYQAAVRASIRKSAQATPETERKRGVFESLYKRRNSMSRETLTNPSTEAVHFGADPINAYNPLVSVYYLVREKNERERMEENPGALSMPKVPGDKPFKIPDLAPPEAAYTNSSSYEMAGEKPTGGRSRPRARTHGEDEVTEGMQKVNLNNPPPVPAPAPNTTSHLSPPSEATPAKKESAAAGIFRRFSTRRHKDSERAGAAPPPPHINVPPQSETPGMKKSFSVRRHRDREAHSPSLPPVEGPVDEQPELLSPPPTSTTQRLKGLGRSTSVNSAELRRRMMRRGTSEGNHPEPPPTSGSDKSTVSGHRPRTGETASEEMDVGSRSRAPTSRAKSLGHARRESIQARRARRDQHRESNVPEETDQQVAEADTGRQSPEAETIKPVYLKGLFSVSTTSNKSLPVIRADIIRVLKQLGVQYWESRSGFSCRHTPSIDLKGLSDNAPLSPNANTGTPHRRRISFGGFMGSDRDREEFRDAQRTPQTPKQNNRHSRHADNSYTNSEESDESDGRDMPTPGRARPAGETTTQVQADLGGSMVLKFEIYIVKVPLLSLHGIQFKKVDGGTWQYKSLAQKILDELRL
ncbi:serine/threonine protein kinase-like protein Kin1 [Saccharata proteae CBS 121410]|uniref:non-specific serine/threonine protein kinase n=1 Tax=Saccharata proteae CBS 121410 TaxID=1314787 RepID=A0A6A5YBL8_9PEZI|nr:serine/threonine protein kinase-like protein Kin1 [Saccharata proteae CBS 121410]